MRRLLDSLHLFDEALDWQLEDPFDEEPELPVETECFA
jgi:hypothetical protein